MDCDKIIYWGLVLSMALVFVLGIRVAFFSERWLGDRGRLAEARLGKNGVAFFIGAIRVLSLTASILALYLFVNLLRIVQCAIK